MASDWISRSGISSKQKFLHTDTYFSEESTASNRSCFALNYYPFSSSLIRLLCELWMRFVLHCRSMCIVHVQQFRSDEFFDFEFRIMDATTTCYAQPLCWKLELKYHFWLTYPNRISQHDYAWRENKNVPTNLIHGSVGELSLYSTAIHLNQI